MKEKEFDVDNIIDTLLQGQFKKPNSVILIPEEQILQLIEKVEVIFMNQPVLLELDAPIKICGIFHILVNNGQETFMVSFTICYESSNSVVFLQSQNICF